MIPLLYNQPMVTERTEPELTRQIQASVRRRTEETAKTVRIVDELRRRLPTMPVTDFIALEARLPAWEQLARHGTSTQRAAVSALLQDVAAIRSGWMPRDDVAAYRDLDARLDKMLAAAMASKKEE